MMDYTDRHFRRLLRFISRHTRLYTEMITAAALGHGRDPARFLGFDPAEQPLTLQLGGSDPAALAKAARMGVVAGYREINLNVGCPSDRVSAGRFGACLMAEPDLVAACVKAMHDAAGVPVTVKTRIGIDEQDPGAPLDHFVATVAAAGCATFIIHARKAWLKGLSPKENREIPPLDYDRVRRLKQTFPALRIILNGGLPSLAAAAVEIAPRDNVGLDGAMLGRAVVEDPFLLAAADASWFGCQAVPPARHDVVDSYLTYAADQVASGARVAQVARPLIGLYRGCAGARGWRQAVTQVMQGGAPLVGLRRVAGQLRTGEALAA
jgi:tRNA-dihydrouridine synthase A